MRRWVVWVGIIIAIAVIVIGCLGVFVWGREAIFGRESDVEIGDGQDVEGGSSDSVFGDESNEPTQPTPDIDMEEELGATKIDMSMVSGSNVSLDSFTTDAVCIEFNNLLNYDINYCSKNIIIPNNVKKVILKGNNASETVKTLKGLSIIIQERTENLILQLDAISLYMQTPIYYTGDVEIGIRAINGPCSISCESECPINVKKLSIKVDSELTVTASDGTAYNADGYAGITSENFNILGNGKLIVIGGNGYGWSSYNNGKNGGNGGVAVNAKQLSIEDNCLVKLSGGNGGNGAKGVTGETGLAGQKGNNESQGPDSYYEYDGRPGGTGGPGKVGGVGGNGGSAIATERTPTIAKGVQLYLNSGNGGNGGNGGTGGTGGKGGNGGDDDGFSFIWWGDMSGGAGGRGGYGGAGGEGGVGGKKGIIATLNGEVLTVPCVYAEEGEDGVNGNKGATGTMGANGSHGYAGAGG